MPKLYPITSKRNSARELAAAAVREYEAKGQANIETDPKLTVRESKRRRYFPWPLFLNLSVIWPEKGEIQRKLYG